MSQSKVVQSASKVQKLVSWAAVAFALSLIGICCLVWFVNSQSAEASRISNDASRIAGLAQAQTSRNLKALSKLEVIEDATLSAEVRERTGQRTKEIAAEMRNSYLTLNAWVRDQATKSPTESADVHQALSLVHESQYRYLLALDYAAASLAQPTTLVDVSVVRELSPKHVHAMHEFAASVQAYADGYSQRSQAASRTATIFCLLISSLVLLLVQFPLLVRTRRVLGQTRELGEALNESNAEAQAINDQLTETVGKLQEQESELSEALGDMKLQTELHLHASRRFQSLFEGLPVGCFTFDTEGVIYEWNRSMSELYGIPVHFALLHPIREVLGQDLTGASLEGALVSVLTGGEDVRIDWQFRRAGIEDRFLQIQFFPLRDTHGHVVGGIGCATDMTEHFQAAAEVSRLANTQKAILNSTEYLVLSIDPNGLLTAINSAAAEKLSLDPKQVVGQARLSNLFCPQAVESLLERSGLNILDLANHPESADHEITMLASDGRRFPVRLTVSRIASESGSETGFVAIGKDVTLEKEKEDRLKLLSMVAESSVDGLLIVDEHCITLFSNHALAKFLGKGADAQGSTLEDLGLGEGHVRKVLRSRRTLNTQVQISRPEGLKFAEVALIPLLEESQAPRSVICRIHDVTTIHRQSQEIKENEARLRAFVENSPLAVAMFDRDFSTLAASNQWSEQYELDPTTVIGSNPFVGQGVLPSGWEDLFHQALTGEIIRSDEDLYLSASGEAIWLKWEIRPWFDAAGAIGGVMMMTEDITNRRLIEKRVRDSEERFELAVEAASVGIWDWNLTTGQFYCSPRCSQILGIKSEDGVGPSQFLAQVHEEDGQMVREKIAEQWENPSQQIQLEYRLPTTSEDTNWILLRAMSLTDDEGEPIRMVGSVEDITNRKATEKVIQESEQRFRDVIDSSGEYVWETDAETNLVFISEKVTEVTGYLPSELLGKSCLALVHPDDIERITRICTTIIATGSPFRDLIFRTIRKDGTPAWLRANAVPVLDPEGNFLGHRGTTADITLHKEAEEGLERAHGDMVDILESITDYFLSVTADDVISYINESAAEFLGKPVELLIGRNVWDVFTGDTGPGLRQLCEITKKTREWRTWESYSAADDRWIEYRIYATSVGLSVFFQDITERRTYQEQIEEQMLTINEAMIQLEESRGELEAANLRLTALATTDGLTGLKNHKTFQEFLSDRFAESQETGDPLAVILMDVDKFKQYNDSFGHPAGDEVLRGVAAALTESVQAPHFVARYGGEEFVVVAVGLSSDESVALAETCRVAIESRTWPNRAVTASFGVAEFDATTEKRQDLIERADKALYKSKEGGRNRVTLWPNDPTVENENAA